MVSDKGTVIEVGRGRAVIMTSRCEFIEIKISGSPLPGDEIVYSSGDVLRPGRFSVKVLALAASLIICCLAGLYAFQQIMAGKAHAYVALEINPGLEMAIDRDYRILKAAGFNSDGHKLAQEAGQKLNLGDSLKAIVRSCMAGGYLSTESSNYIAVAFFVPGGSGWGELLEKVNDGLKNELAMLEAGARIYYFNMDKETWDRAKMENESPIKHLIRQESEKRGQSAGLGEISFKNPLIRELSALAAVRIEDIPRPWGKPEAASGGAGSPLPEFVKSLPRSAGERPPADGKLRQTVDIPGQEDRRIKSGAPEQPPDLTQPTAVPDGEAAPTRKKHNDPTTKQGGAEADAAPAGEKPIVTPGKDVAEGGRENIRSGGGSKGGQNEGGSGGSERSAESGTGSQSGPVTGGRSPAGPTGTGQVAGAADGGNAGGKSGGGQASGGTGGVSTGSGNSSVTGSSVGGSGGRR